VNQAAPNSELGFAGEPLHWLRLDAPGTLTAAAILLAYVGLWLIVTPYAGLMHDAQAYALQALARLDPTVLGGDVFLHFGSQDDFSMFSRLYAAWLHIFGLERGAALATFGLHAAWYGAAYGLLRRLLGSAGALLALGLLVALPGIYGGQRVFHFAEPFMTARLPAEAMVLAALWAWHASRWVACLALLAAAMLIHPLMAAPGLVLIMMLGAYQRRPAASTMPIVAALVLVASLLGAVALRGDAAIMPSDWLAMIRTRSSFLFLDRWQPADWVALVVTVATLIAAAMRIDGPVRTFAKACCWTGLAGLVLAFIAGGLWHLTLLLQGQPWRWLWLARFGAIACLAPVVLCAWRSGGGVRAGAVLLVAAWLTTPPPAAAIAVLLPAGLATVGLALFWRGGDLPASTSRLILRGALLVLAFVIGAGVAAAWPGPREIVAMGLRSAIASGLGSVVPATVLAMSVAWLGLRGKTPARWAVVPSCLMLLVLGLMLGFPNWLFRSFGDTQRAAFEPWRERIPPQAEVLWWNGVRETWFLLDRRSYLSLSQSGGVVFSEPLSVELRRRATVAQRYVDPGYWFNAPRTTQVRAAALDDGLMTELCADPLLGFVVSPDKLRGEERAVDWPRPDTALYLHDCTHWRQGAS
jgi:hypothetical protein